MHRKFRKILHDYKVHAFKVSHNGEGDDNLDAEVQEQTKETLNNDYHYHFHSKPDEEKAELLNLINNYSTEALLPPIVTKILHRQIVLEKKQEMVIELLEQMLEILSQDPKTYSEA